MKKIFTLLLLLGSMNLFSQTIYYVKPTGNDLSNGTSWATAFKTLQKAINTVRTGEVWVAAGTYYPDEGAGQTDNNRGSYFTLKNGAALYGGFAGIETDLSQRNLSANPTILSGDIDQAPGHANSVCVVRGEYGANSSAVMDGFIITQGYSDGMSQADGGGAGMNNEYSSPAVINCIFRDNEVGPTGWGGGAVLNYEGSPTFINCGFMGNKVSGMYTRAGGMYNYHANPRLINCTFWNEIGGEMANFFSFPTMTNCIIWGGIYNNPSSNPTITYSIFPGAYGTGNINKDPLLRNPAAGDLHLRGCSPAINAGNTAAVPSTVNTDLGSRPRIALGSVDIGAFEFQPRDYDILYVKQTATGLNNGTSWTDAFTHLQDALAKAVTCPGVKQIWVAAGTYYPDEGAGLTNNDRYASFVLKNGVMLYGGFAGMETNLVLRNLKVNKTILSGDIDSVAGNSGNAYHVVRADYVDTSAVLDGFTITGGNANGNGTYSNNSDVGGGILLFNCNPSITNCTIRSNNALSYGGGLCTQYTYYLSLTNCLFYDNSSQWGGGIANDDYSNTTVINCTFSGNKAGSGGAIYNLNTSAQVINSILWGNTGGQISAVRAFVTYSLVQDGYYPGTGNLQTDPLFVNADSGDLHLQKTSPAINAGDNASVPITLTTDLDGGVRIYNDTVDIGAYENTGTATLPPHTGPLTLTCPGDYTLTVDSSCAAIADFTGEHAAITTGGKKPVTLLYEPAPGSLLQQGANSISVTATDSTGTTKTCSFSITVVDTISPVIKGATATPSVLFPPNHKMQEVLVQYQTTDCTPVTTTLSVTSNEPQYGTGSGDTGPDWQMIDEHHIRLRGERSGKGTGRIYTITITAMDSAGNTAIATTTVSVPHDNGIGVTTNQRRIEKKELINGLKVQAIPNPTTDGFTIITQSSSGQLLNIQVTDQLGHIVERRTGVPPSGTIFLGNHYRPGMYFLEITQGDTVQTLKLLKQTR